jgi:hypothetical protein
MITEDSTIAQIRETRHQISQQFNHDPKKIIEYYIELQKKFQYRLFNIMDRKQKVADELE